MRTYQLLTNYLRNGRIIPAGTPVALTDAEALRLARLGAIDPTQVVVTAAVDMQRDSVQLGVAVNGNQVDDDIAMPELRELAKALGVKVVSRKKVEILADVRAAQAAVAVVADPAPAAPADPANTGIDPDLLPA